MYAQYALMDGRFKINLKILYYNMIYFITYATHSERLYDILIESAKRNDINLHVIGMGDMWIGWKNRAQKILDHLKTLDRNMIICHIDGFDSVILGNEQEIYNKFITNYKNNKIVFSSDETNNIFIRYFKLKKFTLCRNNFISAGLYIGYNYYIQKLLQEFIDSRETDDQRFFSMLCDNNNDIGIDINNIIFYNYKYLENNGYYKDNRLYVNNINPSIISAPGGVNITNILKNFGYNYTKENNTTIEYFARNFMGTIKYFYVEIFIITLLLLCLFKLMK